MRLDEIKSEINKLELSQKLLLVEYVWDSIAFGNSELPLLEWQKKELNKRYREYKEGRLELHEWETVHKEMVEKI